MIFYTGKFRVDLKYYWHGKREISRLATRYTREFDKDAVREKLGDSQVSIFPTICFSRNIGVGALDLAQLVGEKLGYRVLDREILEYICRKTQLSQQSIKTFDERYPGIIKEFMCRLLGDSPFDMQAYARQLFIVSHFLAHTEPTIFVGRGIHLMLPRNRVFAVRCICSRQRRVRRLAESITTGKSAAEKSLTEADLEQKEFFRKVHGKDRADASEFDVVLNLEYNTDFDAIADAIVNLFMARFPGGPGNEEDESQESLHTE